MLNPLSYIYQISEEENYGYTFTGDTQAVKNTSISEVNEIISRENFTEIVRRNKYTFSKSIKPGESIFVTVTEESELDRLYKVIIKLKGIEGKLVRVLYESPEKFHDKMYENMYNKAIDEAKKIASLSGNSIGKLINVSEVNSMWEGYGDYIDEYKSYGVDLMNPIINFRKQYIRRLHFKFELAGNND
jgi:hypothetical protein